MYCATCGAKIGDNGKFCATCGQTVSANDSGSARTAVLAGVFASQVRARIEKEGQLFVTAIGFYLGFWSLMLLLIGAMGVVTSLGIASIMGASGGYGGGGIVLNATLVAAHILGAFGLASAYGLFHRQEWGRRLAVAVLVLLAILNVFALFVQPQVSGPTLFLIITFVALNIGTAIYLNFTGVKECFRSSN
jgi:hypothetical protein